MKKICLGVGVLLSLVGAPHAEVLTPEVTSALSSLRGAHVRLEHNTIWIFNALTNVASQCIILHAPTSLRTLNQMGYEYKDFVVTEYGTGTSISERDCFALRPGVIK